MNATAREEVRDSMATSGGEAASLVESAMLLRWRAPELALLLADRAVTAAGRDRSTVVRADHLAVVALNRLGRHGQAAHRLLPVLQHADIPAELRHELQLELAHCAVALGETAIALAALRPVLAAGDDVTPVLRGMALVAAAESSVALGRGDIVPSALEEADELFREDLHLDRDTALLLRATAKAINAARHRRDGSAVECEAQARAGRELLTGLADPEHDSGQISARLMLETVLALLDRGEGDATVHETRPMLRRPVRAAAAGAVGWLRLAIATRVHLPEGRHEPALALLADAVEVTQRHGVDAVLAECLEGLSYVHEVRGEFADALHCLRSARAAERRHRRSADTARSALLEHCGVARREVPGLIDQIAALLPGPGWLRAVPDPDTGLLDAEEYYCRVEAALTGSAAHSQVLIAVGPGAADQPPGAGLLVELSKQLRKAAPVGASLGQIGSDRIAVLLPATSRQQAQAWADRVLVASVAALGADLTLGVAQYRAGTGVQQFLADATSALRAATDVARPATVRADSPTLGIRAAPEVTKDQVTTDTVVLQVVSDQLGTPEDGAQVPAVPLDDVEVVAPLEAPAENATEEPTPANVVSEPSSDVGDVSEPSSGECPEPTSGEVSAPSTAEVSEPVASEVSEQSPVERLTAPPSATLPDDEPPAPSESSSAPETRRRRGTNGTPVLVSELLPLFSVQSSGRSGRRRAEDRAEDPSDAENHRNEDGADTQPSIVEPRQTADGAPADVGSSAGRPHSETGPMQALAPLGAPLAPMPRALEWGSNGSASKKAESADVGMGDLLAEALVAFQESGLPPSRDTDTSSPPATDSADLRPTNAADALTDPELRLPDLTAEPRWQPPGTGHQSAAAD